MFKADRMDVIAKTLENIRKAGMVAGLATHALDPLIAAEKMGLNADYYMKTFNSAQYWSAGPPAVQDPNWKPTKQQLVQSEYASATHDNIWETTPRQTAEFFARVNKPFVAYKVLAAGVGCQACHTGSAAHTTSAGIARTTGAVDCRSCHDAKHHPAFDREKAWKIIRHGGDPESTVVIPPP